MRLSDAQIERYQEQGYLAPIRVLSPERAAHYRRRLEAAEVGNGGPFQGAMKQKPHLLFTWLDELVRDDRVLAAVEGVIGPNILCWASGFFTKEAHDPSYVSWHQDLTYWGLEPADIVTAWVALSPSTPESGCMRVVPASHKQDVLAHAETFAEHNLLSRGQEIQVEVDERRAVEVVLRPGEMSLHHVKLIHGSGANRADDRRIGFAIRYVPTYVRQTAGAEDSALLVRGVDAYHHFLAETPPTADLDQAASRSTRR
jgi:non-haem Fe2+, alpha-ketoglutarate-dependent halogenase